MIDRPVLSFVLADILFVGALALWAIDGYLLAENKKWPKVQTVNLHALTPLMDRLQLEAVLLSELSKSYFLFDAPQMASAIRSISWIRDVRIVRSWPLEVNVYLEPHQPLARWQYLASELDNPNHEADKKEVELVNDKGELFMPNSLPDERLPLLASPKLDNKKLNDENRLMLVQQLKQWQPLIESVGMGLSEIRLSSSFSWQVVVNSTYSPKNNHEGGKKIMVELGHDRQADITTKRLKRFLQSWAALQKTDIAMNAATMSVDMRYPNSMAVKAHSLLH